ncbi:hypothetical protein CDAR_407241 [Caerostris darwini]|uniref:Uncharacterized protein n=1 Tax=Caerostris darwini TaxID=1538125 RepID=A0AAV4Q1M2_9ARAC|nr:hypothetical protein CDAR_407241 [Caerostris darwini]
MPPAFRFSTFNTFYLCTEGTHSTSPASFAQGDSREAVVLIKIAHLFPRFEGQASLQTRLAEKEGEGEKKKKAYIIIFSFFVECRRQLPDASTAIPYRIFFQNKANFGICSENLTMAFSSFSWRCP